MEANEHTHTVMLYKPTQPSDTHTPPPYELQSFSYNDVCQTSVTSVSLMFTNASSHCQQQNTRNIRDVICEGEGGGDSSSGMEVKEGPCDGLSAVCLSPNARLLTAERNTEKYRINQSRFNQPVS